jgi:hypothetical protein
MNDGWASEIRDLSEVTLVDLAVVRFLNQLENEGIELAQCPSWVREWIVRERVTSKSSEWRLIIRDTDIDFNEVRPEKRARKK